MDSKSLFRQACTEVLEILKYISKDEYNKIPTEYIRIFNKNASENYQFKYDISKTLEEQNVSEMAQVIIAILYRDYWATNEQKIRIIRYQHSIREGLIKK